MPDGRTRRVFAAMLREEWRLHGRLFRGSHFALFPVLVAFVTAGAAGGVVWTGTAPETVYAGLHGLAVVFGLHTGSIGFVGRDAIDDLLGDLTLLVFSARTLPLSQSRLLGVFVVKDLVYYALLFLLPMSLGTATAVAAVGGFPGVASLVGTTALLWATLTCAFVLGMGATLAGLGLTGRGLPGRAVFGAVLAAGAAAWATGVNIAAYTPYGVFLAPTGPRIAATGVAVAAVSLVGAATFDPTARRPARTVGPTFRRWRRRLGDPVATKTLLDVHRSSGGFAKVLFSAGVLLGVTVGLTDLAGRITGVAPSAGISLGAMLGLSGFTTYNWLTQSDDVDAYRALPLSVASLFTGKLRAFLLLGPVVGLAVYAPAVVWRGGPVGEAIAGAALLVGVACYIFGTTVYLTGFSPNEFLFDTALFAVFSLAMVVPLVPVLVVGFALAPVSPALLAAIGLGSAVLGLIGIALYRRAIPKWTRRYRQD